MQEYKRLWRLSVKMRLYRSWVWRCLNQRSEKNGFQGFFWIYFQARPYGNLKSTYAADSCDQQWMCWSNSIIIRLSEASLRWLKGYQIVKSVHDIKASYLSGWISLKLAAFWGVGIVIPQLLYVFACFFSSTGGCNGGDITTVWQFSTFSTLVEWWALMVEL